MDHDGYFAGQDLLEFALTGILAVLGDEVLDGFAVQHGEDLDVALGIVIGHIHPELVELVRTGALGIQPDVAFLGLAEFGTVSLADERAG